MVPNFCFYSPAYICNIVYTWKNLETWNKLQVFKASFYEIEVVYYCIV